MIKKLIVLIILITMTLTAVTYGEINFKDVSENDWYKKDLNYVINENKEIIKGYPDGTFKGNQTLSVEEFITMLVRTNDEKIENIEGSYWSEKYIKKAKEKKYIEDDLFTDYKKGITREEMAKVISSYLKEEEKKEEISDSKKESLEIKIKDYWNIPEEFKKDVLNVYESGIIKGYPDGKYKGKNTLTRAEGTKVIRKIIDEESREIPIIGEKEEEEVVVTYHEETDTYTVEETDIPLFRVKDYSQKEMDEEGWVNFSIIIDVTSRDMELINKQRKIAKAFLDKKVGKDLSNEIMEFVNTKDDSRDNLPSTFYKWEGKKEVQVISKIRNSLIQIAAWRRD